jgi:GcrA cell cycle regulator
MADQTLAKDTALSWTDERVELLRKLWLEGLSASRIAAELAGGVTRNAVIGKVHRLGLSGRVKAPAAANPTRMRPPVKTPVRSNMPQRSVGLPIRGNTALAVQSRTMPAPQPLREYNDVVVPMTATVTIMDLRESMCRWPVGDPSSAEFRF